MTLLHRAANQPYLILTLTALLWAGNTIAGKLAVGHVSPFLLTTLRWLIAVAILAVVAMPAIRRDWPVIRRHWLFLAVLGAMGFTLFNSLFYLGLTYTTAIHGAIEQAGMPLVVFALNFAIFRIRTTWFQAVGFVLTLTGVLLTATSGNPFALGSTPINIGDVYLLIAVVAYGLFSVLLARKPPLHWLSFITALAFFALLTSIPALVYEVARGRFVWPDLEGWVIAAYTAILPSIMAQVMWIRGLEIIGTNRGGVFMNLVPIFAAAMAVFWLGEDFHAYHAVAMVLVIGGVWITQKKPAG